MPVFAVQHDPPKGWRRTDLAQGSFRGTQSTRGHLHASSSPVPGTSEVGKVRLGPCGLWPQPLTSPLPKPFGVESYRGLSLHWKLLLGERTSKEMEKLLQKNKGSVEMMSSEQESYASNICHQTLGTTIYIVPLLHPAIPHDRPTEMAVVLWCLDFLK